jgi:hypothetical protein
MGLVAGRDLQLPGLYFAEIFSLKPSADGLLNPVAR